MRACIKSLPSDIIVMISDDSRLNLMFLNDLWCKWCTRCMARLLRTYVFSHSFKWNQIDCISGEVFSSFLVLHTKNEEKPRTYMFFAWVHKFGQGEFGLEDLLDLFQNETWRKICAMPQMLHVESESGLEWWNFDYIHVYLKVKNPCLMLLAHDTVL